MKCSNCDSTNSPYACYCHKCGKKLKTKVNGWLICSVFCAVFAIFAIGMGVWAYYNYDNAEYYRNKYCNSECEINNLRSRLPQTYLTKYPEQYYYHICTNSFVKSDCYANQGTRLTIYKQSTTEGGSTLYGLTDFGWVPMDRLTIELQ